MLPFIIVYIYFISEYLSIIDVENLSCSSKKNLENLNNSFLCYVLILFLDVHYNSQAKY